MLDDSIANNARDAEVSRRRADLGAAPCGRDVDVPGEISPDRLGDGPYKRALALRSQRADVAPGSPMATGSSFFTTSALTFSVIRSSATDAIMPAGVAVPVRKSRPFRTMTRVVRADPGARSPASTSPGRCAGLSQHRSA